MQDIRQSRYSALDGARGVAALTVVLCHCLSIEMPFRTYLVDRAGSAFLSLGQTAVVFFFVLSGFVLALKLNKQPDTAYWKFQASRLARLYPPFLIALLAAALLCAATVDPFYRGSGVAFRSWTVFPDETSFIRQALLVGLASSDVDLVGPAWSLVYEVRAGLVIPLFWAWSRRRRLTTGLVATLALYAGAFLFLWRAGLPTTPFLGETPAGAAASSLHYFACFFLGCLLAQAQASGALARVATRRLALVAVAALVAGTLAKSDLAIAVASAAFIATALRGGAPARALTAEPIAWLGRISYPLYLIHLPILLALQHAFVDKMSTPLVSLFAIGAALIAAEALARTVERWSIAWSHRASSTRLQSSGA